MGKETGISWCDHTFNPWWGCTKVSLGCQLCYASTLSSRWGYDIWGPKADRRFFDDKHWAEPLKWNRDAVAAGERRRVFCASMADVFERHMVQHVQEQLAFARQRLWKLIEATPMLDWLLLTKRPEHIPLYIPRSWLRQAPHNVWYGTSVEDQAAADTRIPLLLQVPAVVRFLSCEPLLGPVDLHDYLGWHMSDIPDDQKIHWVIAGGESGSGARPMHPGWARSLRDQCQAAGIAFHFKQRGEWTWDHPGPLNLAKRKEHFQDDQHFYRVGKVLAGRELDGRTWDEFPEVAV